MQTLRNHSNEVQIFLAKKGRSITVAPLGKGSSVAKLTPLMAEISGRETFFCIGQRSDGFKGRDHLRQKSQKIKWTKAVRINMGQTIQHREHLTMLRSGKVEVGAGLMDEIVKTGTEG
jgi:hypothetical protein